MEKSWYLELFPGRFAELAAPLAGISPKVSAMVEKQRDLMGRIQVHVLGYETTCTLGPCYAVAGDGLYDHLRRILDKGLVLDALKTRLVGVLSDGTATARTAYIELTAAQEDRIAFRLHFTGREQTGRFEAGRFVGDPG